ncbi:MAG: ABC transporter substrate-binding protein [Candidatus Dojkabacteria bacterium]|jgi:peptide/nickel transport system substrate-binding protein|nr:ABC transporter substrate-binding protein [Candidatus Dojkabacteria bacterium]
MSKEEKSEKKNRLVSMKEAFLRINPSKTVIKVGIKKKESFRDWLWNYPSNLSNFFQKTSPISFILVFLLLGSSLFFFFRSDIFATAISNEKNDVFVEGNIGAISSFNPLFATQNPVDSDIQALVFEKFINISNDGKPQDGIAIDWIVSSDGKIYDFVISLDHTWQDGEPLTMEDILFTFDISKELSSNLGYDTVGSALSDVKINMISEDKVRFTLPESNATFFEAISVYIVPAHKFEDIQLADIPFSSFAKYPVGSGPYEVYRSEPNVVYLKASNYFWVTPKIETFIYRLYSDYESLEAAFRNGILDAMGGVNGSDMSYIDEYSGFGIKEVTLNSRLRMIFFNTRKEKLQSKEIRQALNYLTNKSKLLELSNVSGSLANGPIAASSWAYDSKEVSVYEFNQEKANKILNNLGYSKNEETGYYEKEDKKILSFTLSYYDNDLNERLANSLKELWRQEGIVLNLEPLSYKQITQEIVATRDFELLMFEVETTVDPDQYNLWHSLKSNYPDLNISGYSYERVDILLEDARRSTKLDTRKKNYSLFQRYLTQDSPAIFLYHPNYTYVVKDSVEISDISNIFYPYQRFDNVEYWSK